MKMVRCESSQSPQRRIRIELVPEPAIASPTHPLPQSVCRRYATHPAELSEDKAGFGTVTLETFIEALHGASETDHAAALLGRYVDWSLIDEEIEANFPPRR